MSYIEDPHRGWGGTPAEPDVDEPVQQARPGPVWRALCLSHAPALIINPDSGGYIDLGPLLDEITERVGPRHEHPSCDLLVGGFLDLPGAGGPTLHTVVCPPHPFVQNTGPHQHEEATSVEAPWLGLLATTMPAGANFSVRFVPQGDPRIAAVKRLPECWSAERARRLAPLLGVVALGE